MPRKLKPRKMSRQYRWQLLRKGAGLCPICGKKPDKRAVRSRLCTKHLKAQREWMRKRGKAKRTILSPYQWAELDWSLGYDMIASMTSRTRGTVESAFKRLLARRMVKATDCPDYSRMTEAIHRKRKVREILESV